MGDTDWAPWLNQPNPAASAAQEVAQAGVAAGAAPPTAGTYGAPSFAGNSGSGFKYDKDTLTKLAQSWQKMANDFQDDVSHLERLVVVQPPGKEYASQGQVDQVNTSITALRETLQARQQYSQKMFEKFNQALGKYAIAEDNATEAVNKPGGSL